MPLVLLIVATGSLAFVCDVIWKLEHLVYRSERSPDSKYIAYFIELGESGEPPYGQAVKISRAWNPMGYMTGDYVFKGHCTGPVLDWRTSDQLVLICTEHGTQDKILSVDANVQFQRIRRAK
jgi:hypothetical protein